MQNKYILKIDITHLQEKSKRNFLKSVMQYATKEEFEPFRKCLTSSGEVFSANERDYGSLIYMNKIIQVINQYKGYFFIYATGNKIEEVHYNTFLHLIKTFKERNNLPAFKYSPNAYENGLISYYNDTCEVCGENRDFFGSSTPFGEEELESVCIYCIHSGEAYDRFDAIFNDDGSVTIKDEEKIKEMSEKTPGILSWQEISWLEHCNDFCAYLGIVKWDNIKHLENELKDELEIQSKEHNSLIEKIKEALNSSYMDGHLFQCLHCGKHRLSLDLN